MSSRVFDYDRSTYVLESLKLDVEGLENPSLTESPRIGSFKVLGKGGFGSIFVGTISKCTVPLFNTNFKFQLLGLYHGVLLAQPRKHTLVVEKENVTPITVAVKRIDGEPEHLLNLTREASNLKVLWGHRNFVTIYGATQSHDLGCLCLVMDLIHGCNLNQFLRTCGTAVFKDWDSESESLCGLWRSNEISWWMEKLRLFREIVIALIVCHKEQVYHGDLKGTNILLDRCLVPKMVDFGMSFRHTDIPYLQSLGGSLFWAAPEVIDGHEDGTIPNEVVANPYPSDVYSLGMVLTEIMLDGEIPESLTVENFIADKCSGGCPISLDDVNTVDPLFNERVVDRLKILIDKCCEADRQNRISLGECLSKLDEIYSCLSSSFSPSPASTQYEKMDHLFSKTTAYVDMVCRFKERFPHVGDYMLFNPSKNTVMDEQENLLVHYFCKLDYAEGVEYILEKSAWDFRPDRDLPYLSLLCVTEESLRTLKYLAASWPQMIKKQLLLLHKACLCNNQEVCQFLLLDVGMDFDTWEVQTVYSIKSQFRMEKPIHKLAARGKTEMVRLILANWEVDPDYVNTVVPGIYQTPLYYAIRGDHVETMNFLLERGGALERQTVHLDVSISWSQIFEFLDSLFPLAIKEGCLQVFLELSDRRWRLCDPQLKFADPGGIHIRCLKEHIKNVAHLSPSITPLRAACQKGSEGALKSFLHLLVHVTKDTRDILRLLLSYIAIHGSKEMLDLLLQKHGFDVEVELNTYYVQQLLLDEASCSNVQDKTWLHRDTLLKENLVTYGGNYVSLEKIARWSNNKEISDHLVDMKLQPEVVGSANQPQATGLGSQSKQLHHKKIVSEGEAYAHIILSGFETGSAPEKVISIHHEIDFPYQLAYECCKMGYLGILQFLEDCGLNLRPNPRLAWDLHITAVEHGHVGIVEFLFKRGFSVNSYAGDRCISPLQRACESPHMDPRKRKEMVLFLLEAGADPNYTDQGGYTAMDIAAGMESKGSREVVQLLIEAGFDLGKLNRWGEDYLALVARM
jgi:serine/threonine protein kinase/ankyrin repeat protein